MHPRLLRFFQRAALAGALLAGCGSSDDPAPAAAPPGEDKANPPASVIVDQGLITAITATNADGVVPEQYLSFFPIKISVTITPTSDERIADLPVFVGLVEKVADPHAAARTCLLGSIDASFGDGPARTPETFTKEFIVNRDCLVSGDAPQPQGVFNVWVGLNPGLEQADGKHLNPGDINTQFFTEEGVDTDGQDRNKQCIGPDGKPGCVIDIPVTATFKRHDARMASLSTESTIAPQPSDCVPDFAAPLAETNGDLFVYGSDPHTGKVRGEKPMNAMEQAEAGGQAIPISYEICPRENAEDGSLNCVSGTTYTPLKIAGETEEGFVDSVPSPPLVMGRPLRFHHRLFAPAGTEACNRIIGAEGAAESWLAYGNFNLKACAAPPFPADDAKNNCVVVPIRLVRSTPQATGQATSQTLNKTYSTSSGSSSSFKVTSSFSTLNTLDLSGASSATEAKADLSGWFSKSLFRAYADAGAYVAITGSGVEAGVTALGYTLWSYSKIIPELHFEESKSYSKSVCYTYGYTVAGLGLKIEACVTGSIGVKGKLDVAAKTGSSGKFQDSTKIGSIVGSVTPFARISLDAEAYANLGAIKGGIEGTLTLASVELPATAQLEWGLVEDDGIGLLIRASAGLNLELSTLDGSIHAWVDVIKPSWCSCGSWCPGYPCDKWSEVYDDDIVEFDGFNSSTTLYKSPFYELLLK
jgi:hypothetical protein